MRSRPGIGAERTFTTPRLGSTVRTPYTPCPRRLHIDWTRCDGRGLCTELLPRLLHRDDWGYPIARDGSREPAVPPSALPQAHNAVDRCPRLALSLITDEPASADRKRGPSS
ncbi:ferredoxin [Mycobacterium sp. AZCC_0083]|uniref:ferredoxin n=1 Tax=Mycobacterium sp. AZCC_0083 TaxID=2735882 RepID=UPI0016181423|nr:ferredoxin [Mycobacterium sp. AZCC_0083]